MGSSDQDSPAELSLSVTPNELSAGGFAAVEISLSGVDANGLLLKVTFPDALAYVRGSASLEGRDGEPAEIEPSIAEEPADTVSLVFVVSPEHLGEDGHGALRFRIKALEQLDGGFVSLEAREGVSREPGPNRLEPDSAGFIIVDQEQIEVVDTE